MSLIVAAEYAGLVVLLLAGLSLIGWPIKHLLGQLGSADVPVTAPLIGLCVVQVVSWYWFVAGGHGLEVPTVTLLVLGLAGSVLVLRASRWRPEVDRRRVLFAAAALVSAGAVAAVNFSSIFHLSYLTTSSLGNGDAAGYAMISRHLATSGFFDPGGIAGTDLGHIADGRLRVERARLAPSRRSQGSPRGGSQPS